MPAKNQDLHGSAPDQSPVALLLIDVINDLEFDGGEKALKQAIPMAKAMDDVITEPDTFFRLVASCARMGFRRQWS